MLAWRRVGEGRPLLLLNGYAATKDDWDPAFVNALANGLDVLCLDNRGMGESQRGDGELTVERMAAEVVEVMDALEIERAAVCGWSMGGCIAQALAASEPARIDALILLSTEPGGPRAVRCSPDVGARLRDHSGTPREQATRLISLLFPEPVASEIDAQFGDVVAEARARLDPDVLDEQWELLERWHDEPSDKRLAGIGCPTLVVTGDEDVVVPPENSEVLTAAISGARLERFPGGGHGFMAQEPERLARLILDFL